MTEVYVHGVTRAAAEVVEAAGAEAIADGGLVAIVSAAAGETRAAALMRRHWRVLEAVAESARTRQWVKV